MDFDRLKEFLLQDINVLKAELGNRTFNPLKNQKIHYIAQIYAYDLSPANCGISMLGGKSLAHLKEKLNERGYPLGFISYANPSSIKKADFDTLNSLLTPDTILIDGEFAPDSLSIKIMEAAVSGKYKGMLKEAFTREAIVAAATNPEFLEAQTDALNKINPVSPKELLSYLDKCSSLPKNSNAKHEDIELSSKERITILLLSDNFLENLSGSFKKSVVGTLAQEKDKVIEPLESIAIDVFKKTVRYKMGL